MPTLEMVIDVRHLAIYSLPEGTQLWPEIPAFSANNTPFIECIIHYNPIEITKYNS